MAEKMTVKVNLVNLIVDMANEVQAPSTTIGAKIALGCLERIAARACELGDAQLLKELQTLCMVEAK